MCLLGQVARARAGAVRARANKHTFFCDRAREQKAERKSDEADNRMRREGRGVRAGPLANRALFPSRRRNAFSIIAAPRHLFLRSPFVSSSLVSSFILRPFPKSGEFWRGTGIFLCWYVQFLRSYTISVGIVRRNNFEVSALTFPFFVPFK